jgi:hypothetical protein
MLFKVFANTKEKLIHIFRVIMFQNNVIWYKWNTNYELQKTILQQKTMFYTRNNSFIISTEVFFVTLNLYLGGGGDLSLFFNIKI